MIDEIYDLKTPIVIFVDELDRCRPTYSIEILEVIKHFFETKGCVFLVATDTEALQHSIRSVYGDRFDAETYLKRFFGRKIRLPEVSILEYLNTEKFDFMQYVSKGVCLYPFIDISNESMHITFFAMLFTENKLDLRGIEQVLQKFFATLDYIANNNTQKHIINIVVLMIGIVENQLNIVSYDDRTSSHYITHSIPDGRLFEWCNLRPYIDLNFSLVTKTTSKRVYKADSSYDTYFNGTECLIIKSSSFSNFQTAIGLQFSNEIRKYFDLENNGNYKYWLWDDYKNIIELSSYIE